MTSIPPPTWTDLLDICASFNGELTKEQLCTVLRWPAFLDNLADMTTYDGFVSACVASASRSDPSWIGAWWMAVQEREATAFIRRMCDGDAHEVGLRQRQLKLERGWELMGVRW